MADVHIICAAPTEDELEMMRDKMRAFIFPNNPRSDSQIAAFDKACTYQIAHEKPLRRNAEIMPCRRGQNRSRLAISPCLLMWIRWAVR